jgi:predicted RNase H-like HicB family nuclease
MNYAVVLEKAENNYGAYVPDLPGCIATGDTLEETVRLIREAIAFHVEGMLLHGETVPQATTRCREIEIDLNHVAERVRASGQDSGYQPEA